MSNFRYPFSLGFPYHIYNRGFEKQRIFFSDRDYARFLDRMDFLLREDFSHLQLHAFCLIPNHFHLIMTQPVATPDNRSLSAFMQRLQLAYAMYAKTKYPDIFLRWLFFEGRFHAKILEDEQDIARCMSYVCYNAIKHEIVTDIRDWPWTSYHQIVDGITYPHLPQVTYLDSITIGEYVDIDEE